MDLRSGIGCRWQFILLVFVLAAFCMVNHVNAELFTFSGTVYEQNPTTSAVLPKSGIKIDVFGSNNFDSYPGDGSSLLGTATSDANGRYSITIAYDVEFPK